MNSIAIMATYPKRRDTVGRALESLISQVDKVVLIANGYREGELDAGLSGDIEIRIPVLDLKDTGKFSVDVAADSLVYLCDDDIVYPADYVREMRACYLFYESLSPVIGVHGVLYPDFFDGDPASRLVYPFDQALEKHAFVNQVGTGTALCRGYQLPPLSYMRGSSGFVDLRFGVYCQDKGFPRICIARREGWLTQLQTSESIFEAFTRGWPSKVVQESQRLAGVRYLPATRVPKRG